MTSPGYAALLVAHVVVAVLSYGALGATGAYARAVRGAADPYHSDALRRFFRPGHNLAARAIFAVPLLGAGLVLWGGAAVASRAFPWIGLALWLLAAGVATGVIWPAEAVVQEALVAGESGGRASLDAACRKLERASIVISLLFLSALVVMIAQP